MACLNQNFDLSWMFKKVSDWSLLISNLKLAKWVSVKKTVFPIRFQRDPPWSSWRRLKLRPAQLSGCRCPHHAAAAANMVLRSTLMQLRELHDRPSFYKSSAVGVQKWQKQITQQKVWLLKWEQDTERGCSIINWTLLLWDVWLFWLGLIWDH